MDPNHVARQLVHFSRMFKASESNANHFHTLEEYFACCQILPKCNTMPKIKRITHFYNRLTCFLPLHLVYERLHITFLAPYYSIVWKLHNDPTRYHCGTFLCQCTLQTVRMLPVEGSKQKCIERQMYIFHVLRRSALSLERDTGKSTIHAEQLCTWQ